MDTVQRLNAWGAIGDDADRAVAMVVTVALRIRCPDDSRILPLKLGKTPRSSASAAEASCPTSHTQNPPHNPCGQVEGFGRVIWHVQIDEQIGKSHQAHADFSIAFGDRFDIGQGVMFMSMTLSRNRTDRRIAFSSRSKIDPSPGRRTDEKMCEVDRPQIARLVRQEGLLTAWVGAFHTADVGGRIGGRNAVQKDDARFAGVPGGLREPLEHGGGLHPRGGTARPRIDQRVVLSMVQRMHERIRQCDGHIKVREFVGALFDGDEVEDIRMVDA